MLLKKVTLGIALFLGQSEAATGESKGTYWNTTAPVIDYGWLDLGGTWYYFAEKDISPTTYVEYGVI